MDEETTIIEDFVLLGLAVPEQLRDGRRTICAAGYSRKRGFVRAYPTRKDANWKRWDIVQLEVRRNPQDSREESWRLAERNWGQGNSAICVIGSLPNEERTPLLMQLVSDCVSDLNLRHQSLGIVKPERSTVIVSWSDNPRHGEPFQLGLELAADDVVDLKRDYPYEPRVRYRCSSCHAAGDHDMQILDWGFYQWQRKNPDKLEQVWDNARFGSLEHDLYFLVGNQQNRRTSYMVISVIWLGQRPEQLSLW